MRSLMAGWMAALLVAGCSSKPPVVHVPPVAIVDPWTVANTDPAVKTPALLWNGLLGARLDSSPATVAQFFDIDAYGQEGEEKILALSSPLNFVIDSNGSNFLPTVSEDFKEVLDFRTGAIIRSWTQKPVNCQVEVRTVIHPDKRILAQRWTFRPREYMPIHIRNYFVPGEMKVISSDTATRRIEFKTRGVTFQILDAVKNKAQGIWSSREDVAVWGGPVDAESPLQFDRVLSAEKEPTGLTYDDVARSSEEALKHAWQTDIEIDGPVEDQQFIRSALFYLRSAIHPDGKMSISPMGLSSDIYNGHVFWDADIWVFPALALIDPERAAGIPFYRLRRSHEYPGGVNKESGYSYNMGQWLREGRPIGNGKLGNPTQPLIWPEASVKVSWESSVSGRETVPGPSRFQDHVTGSVWFMLQQASALGLADASHVSYFTRGATDFYLQRISKRADGRYDLKGTMSPDEHHTGDNDLYTNILAQHVLEDGLWKAKNSVPKLHLPKDNETFLTYDNDGLRGYKQAAAVLSIYPVQYPPAEKQAMAMMERFAGKVTKNGPAMTDSIHALIWARLGEKEKAYRAWHDSWKPFVKPPFLLFSEKRNSSRTYFTTGAAGSLQTVLYGFAGLRIDDKQAPNAQWSLPLKNGKVLSIAPNLPKEWKKLTLRNLTILGKKYTFQIENDKVRVNR